MSNDRFQLNSPTIALLHINGRKTAVVIAAHEIVTLISDSPDEPAFVTIDWNGQTLEMFREDIQNRGERVSGVAA